MNGYEDNGPNEHKAVAKGAALLDKILPGWHNQIDLGGLDMSAGSMCMMGQLFGNGVEAELAEEMYPEELREARERVYGDCDYSSPADGYAVSSVWSSPSKSLVGQLIKKAGIPLSDRKTLAQYKALQHVCSGHDNKCLWADEIATRRAKDAAKKGSKRGKKARE